MAYDQNPDSYPKINKKLSEAETNQKLDDIALVGDYEVLNPMVSDEMNKLAPIAKVQPTQHKDTGIVYHDHLDELNNDLPLTAQLLEQTKGLDPVWQLKPRGPKNDIEKKFEKFLKALASHQGCTVEHLRKQGFSCQSKGENEVTLNFPSKELTGLFQQMLTDNISAEQCLKPISSKEDENKNESSISFKR